MTLIERYRYVGRRRKPTPPSKLRQRLAIVAAVLAALIGLACSGPAVPAEEPQPIPQPSAGVAVPDPGVRPTPAVR